MNKQTRLAKRQQAREIAASLKDHKWLGVIVTWTSGTPGSTHKQSDVVVSLQKAGIDPKVCREISPRNAWARASKKLTEERVIDVFKQNESELVFQLTKKHLNSSQWEFSREAFLTLNKVTGQVTPDREENQDLANFAQGEVDRCTEDRVTNDITRIVQRVFDQETALIPFGGNYFVPQEHTEVVDRVEIFLKGIGGSVDYIPVPTGTSAGNKAVQNAVADAMGKLVEDHKLAVSKFEVNTRKDTISRAADEIKNTRVRIEAYAHYLGERQQELLNSIKDANQQLKEQVEKIGGGTEAYSQYDWDQILDGKTHQLTQGEDYLASAATCLALARTKAKKIGRRIRSTIKDDGKTIILQAVPIESK